jgi:hypothetical protein
MFSWLVAGSLTLLMVTSLTAGTTKDRSGTVVRFKGSARYSTGNNVWQPVKTGTVLKSGYLVQTAADSYVDVVLGGTDLTPPRAVAGDTLAYKTKAQQDMIRLQQDTVLAFDKLTVTDTGSDEVTETQLDLRSGRIFGSVKRLSTGSLYEVKLPNGVAGVRGTDFSLSAVGLIQVLRGSMVISWAAPDGTPMTQAVNAGWQFETSTGLLSPIPEHDKATLIHCLNQNHVSLLLPTDPPILTPGNPYGTHVIYYVADTTIHEVSPTQSSNDETGTPGGGGQ